MKQIKTTNQFREILEDVFDDSSDIVYCYFAEKIVKTKLREKFSVTKNTKYYCAKIWKGPFGGSSFIVDYEYFRYLNEQEARNLVFGKVLDVVGPYFVNKGGKIEKGMEVLG